jgi:hypothetical protein
VRTRANLEVFFFFSVRSGSWYEGTILLQQGIRWRGDRAESSLLRGVLILHLVLVADRSDLVVLRLGAAAATL